MIVAGTGHRLSELVGIFERGGREALHHNLTALAEAYLVSTQPSEVISGMAVGWDMALAEAAENLAIPLLAAIPCLGQDVLWDDDQRERWRSLCSRAKEVVYVSERSYDSTCMKRRNEWMVNRADRVVALWDGRRRGGTWSCVAYANKKKVPVDNLWEQWSTRWRRSS